MSHRRCVAGPGNESSDLTLSWAGVETTFPRILAVNALSDA